MSLCGTLIQDESIIILVVFHRKLAHLTQTGLVNRHPVFVSIVRLGDKAWLSVPTLVRVTSGKTAELRAMQKRASDAVCNIAVVMYQ